jgi:hypothetical protein
MDGDGRQPRWILVCSEVGRNAFFFRPANCRSQLLQCSRDKVPSSQMEQEPGTSEEKYLTDSVVSIMLGVFLPLARPWVPLRQDLQERRPVHPVLPCQVSFCARAAAMRVHTCDQGRHCLSVQYCISTYCAASEACLTSRFAKLVLPLTSARMRHLGLPDKGGL